MPHEFHAPVFIVRHASAQSNVQILVDALNKAGTLTCKVARHAEEFTHGCIYVPPADHHMMIDKGRILVTKGAQENRSRPAIDPLFRSAAVRYGNRVIAVVLTGIWTTAPRG